MENIGKTILKRRKEIALTQQELADLSGVGINTLVALERGKGNPSIRTLSKIADVIGFELRLEFKPIPAWEKKRMSE